MKKDAKFCRQTTQMIDRVDESYTKPLLKESRKTASRMIEFITGHCNLRYHCLNRGQVDNAKCRLCDMEFESEDPEHLLWTCPRLNETRIQLFGYSRPEGLVPYYKLKAFVESPSVSRLMNYRP